MDTQRLLLLLVFFFSCLMLWDAWQRKDLPPPGAPATDDAEIVFGAFALNLGTRQLARNGDPIPLTTGEFALLKVLASHPGRVFSRDDLVAAASGGPDRLPFDRSIDARVARLRRKLDDPSDAPRYIRTVWGVGYVFIGHEA